MSEVQPQVKQSIRVLQYAVGFPEGTVISPEHSDYDTFEVWARLNSIITDVNGKGGRICEFVEAEETEDDDEETDEERLEHLGKATEKVKAAPADKDQGRDSK